MSKLHPFCWLPSFEDRYPGPYAFSLLPPTRAEIVCVRSSNKIVVTYFDDSALTPQLIMSIVTEALNQQHPDSDGYEPFVDITPIDCKKRFRDRFPGSYVLAQLGNAIHLQCAATSNAFLGLGNGVESFERISIAAQLFLALEVMDWNSMG